MKCNHRLRSCLVLLAGLVQAGLSLAQAGASLHPTAQQVTAHVWMVQGVAALGSSSNRNFISNAGFVVTPAGVVVIDALGSPVLAGELLQEIHRITPLPVTHVIVTHYHADHIYGLQTFKAVGAKIIAHEAAKEYLNSDTAALRLQASREELAPWVDADTHLVAADEWLSGKKDLVVGGVHFHIQPVGPAHTPEDVVINVPSEGVLFSGDIVFRNRLPYVGKADSRHWIESLGQILADHPRIIVPGHGPVSRDPEADLTLTRDYLIFLRQSMAAAARDLEPFDSAYDQVDWSRFASLPLFHVANRMNAYNTYLLMEEQGDDAGSPAGH